MKMRFFLSLIAVLLTFSFSACSSSDDEPVVTDGQKVAQWIQDNLLTAPTAIDVYAETGDDSNLYGAVADEAAARRLVSEMIGGSWSGESIVYTVPGDYGTIRLSPSDREGVFCTAVINVKGVRPFTLHLATESYCKSENMRVMS